MVIEKNELILGGGCFWCVEAAFQLVDGVIEVESGYAGGSQANPTYRDICYGNSDHAEVVRVRWDPQITNVESILTVFFKVHDPTTLNRQGNDIGTQYRSFIGYFGEQQKNEVLRHLKRIESDFDSPIVTELQDSPLFYIAEEEHQNYYRNHSNQPYCQIVIKPKLDKVT